MKERCAPPCHGFAAGFFVAFRNFPNFRVLGFVVKLYSLRKV
jgi:hypothetical protein